MPLEPPRTGMRANSRPTAQSWRKRKMISKSELSIIIGYKHIAPTFLQIGLPSNN
jgi:hypothetical protein